MLEDTITPWLGPLAPWTRKIVVDNEERARRWFLVCVIVSMLLHFAVFLIPVAQRMGAPASSETQGPLTVRLANPAPRAPPVSKVEPAEKPTPRQTAVIATRRPVSKTKPAFTVPPPPEQPQPRTQPTTQPPDENNDMMARVNARRAAREAAENAAAQENAAAAGAEGGSSLDQRIAANIKRSQRSNTDGTGGVFMIKSIGVREGTFIFNGFNPIRDHFRTEIKVDAGLGGNVKLAIVRGMIEQIIRKYKTGDFEFESHRLGRIVTMSARPADNEQLENFMMQEFFGEDVPKTQSH